MYQFYRGPQARRMDTARGIIRLYNSHSDKVAQMVNRDGRWMAYKVFLMGNGYQYSGEDQPRVDVTDICDDPAAIIARLG